MRKVHTMVDTIESEGNGTSQRSLPVQTSVCSSHVIICGHIETHSLASFLHDFLHKGREEVDELDVLIIDKYAERRTPTTVLMSALHSKKKAWHRNGSVTQTVLHENPVFRWQHYEHHRPATSTGKLTLSTNQGGPASLQLTCCAENLMSLFEGWQGYCLFNHC